jgi:hypothetical protein
MRIGIDIVSSLNPSISIDVIHKRELIKTKQLAGLSWAGLYRSRISIKRSEINEI